MKLNWGHAIIIFFVIFIGWSITFVVFSFKQDIELVEDDYYNKGANYTVQMDINERSAVYDDSIYVSNNNSQVIIVLPKSIHSNTDSLNIHFYNPSTRKKDYKIILSEIRDTNYINRTPIQSGRYKVKIKWNIEQKDFFIEQTLDIN